jgi:uncharacterized membrane protein YecN with MAPEG domain
MLQVLLALNVSLNRILSKTSHGCSEDPNDPLYRAVVAHRNACEYGPLFCILIVVCQLAYAPPWSVWLGPVAVVVRTMHAVGIVNFSLRKPNLFRRAGATFSYLLGLLLSGLILYTRL